MNDESTAPKYLTCKQIRVQFDENESLEKLWTIHNESLKQRPTDLKNVDKSLLDLKIHLANRIFSDCIMCEKRCHVNRTKEPGFCQITRPWIASEFLHRGEEQLFIPSHTIFFSGCNFQCVFCQNFDISQQRKGLFIRPQNMAKIIEERSDQSRNVNWVGGEPTPNLFYILEVLNHLDKPLPQIWNSNMYCSQETLGLLNGIIDMYLIDFKFGTNTCAKSLAHVSDYVDVLTRNIRLVQSHTQIFIRHLVLPNHIDCCSKPIMKWIASNAPQVQVNIMDQYHPEYLAKNDPLLHTACLKKDIFIVKQYAKNLGLHIYE